MVDSKYAAIAFVIMAALTLSMRVLPFLVFGGDKKTPAVIEYLGKVLPYALMGMLVVYCLRHTDVLGESHGLPELIATLSVVGSVVLTKNSILSIIIGTAVYILLLHFVF